MKKILFGGIAIFVIAAAVAFNVNISSQKDNISSFSVANIVALASESGSDKWFSNLNTVSCPISNITIIGGTVIDGVPIPIYYEYTIYGTKKVCEREFTTNTCNISDQTPCKE